eukprot:TRINITY_DN30955_c0_g1_i1.p1 TRINITY_DN30955_c0_g1~~TRINITY_DN30955_c0_g1_i1.p1  ORF type:complete len:367 (+),score=56.53 TRINITY_DN30955_c0_g1_i1:74-1174(+)
MASILNKRNKSTPLPKTKKASPRVPPKCLSLNKKKKVKEKRSIYWLGEKIRKYSSAWHKTAESRLGKIDGSRYKRVEHSPLIPINENDMEFVHECGNWRYTSLPSSDPSSKKELDYLLDVTDQLLLNCDKQHSEDTDTKESIMKQYDIWDTAMFELHRHTSKYCCQRGVLLNEIRTQIGNLFKKLCALIETDKQPTSPLEVRPGSCKSVTPSMPIIAKTSGPRRSRLPTVGDVLSFSSDHELTFAVECNLPDPPRKKHDDNVARLKKWTESTTDKALPPPSDLADWVQNPCAREAELHQEVAQLLNHSKQTLAFRTPPPEEIAIRAGNIRSNSSLPPLPPPDLPDFSSHNILTSHTTPSIGPYMPT